jgi:hypothetical protein
MQLSAAPPVPPDWPRIDPIEQEYSLALPFDYRPEAFALAPRIGVMLHAFFMELVEEFRAYLDQIPVAADLFISTDSSEKKAFLRSAFADWPRGSVDIRVFPNRGRDVAPKLVGFGFAHAGYDLVLHLHTKQSVHESGLAGWRPFLLETLLGSPETVTSILEAFRQVPKLGLLAPQHIEMLRPWIRWGDNFAQAEELATRMGMSLSPDAPLDFASGSMFWARPAALAPLLDMGLSFEDFPEESRQIDGTLAHAIERLYFHACEKAGFDWMKISARGLLNDERGVTPVSSPLGLRRFVARTAVRLDHLGDTPAQVSGAEPLHLRMPLRPNRPMHILWHGALGDRLAVGGHVRVMWLADARAGLGLAFADSATSLVLLQDEPGLLHPLAQTALLQMSAAQGGRALLVPAVLPDPNPVAVEPGTFRLSELPGKVLAIPPSVYAELGPLMTSETLHAYARRAGEAGFALHLCPRALFFPTAIGASLPGGAEP